MNYYFVYIMVSRKNGTLYIGVTSNLAKRVYEHKNEEYEGFSKRYKTKILVHYEIFGGIKEAIAREKQLKKWKRQWKINLIEENNPNWRDLYIEIIN